MRIKIFFILILFFSAMLAFFSTRKALAYPLCAVDTGTIADYSAFAYNYSEYSCDSYREDPITHIWSPGKGCVLNTYSITYPDCNQFAHNQPYECGFCKKLSDVSCTQTLIRDGADRYYSCNYVKSNPQNFTIVNSKRCPAYTKQTYCFGYSPNDCKPKTVDCTGKCGKWSKGCGLAPKDCGQSCGSGKTCVVDSTSKTASKTNTGGYCKTTNNCQPKTCADLGYNGKKGSVCEKQSDGCTGTITCGGCNSGLSCTGKNAKGAGGNCTEPPTSDITVLVFYDHFTKNSQKGTEPSYTVCYPSTDGTNKPAGSANVTFTAQSGDTGVPSKTYTYASYKNCKTNGSSSTKGYTFTTSGTSTKITLAVPTGYQATGYNYTIDGKAAVRCIGNASAKCTNTLNSTPNLQGYNITVRLGIAPGTTNAKISGFAFIDDNSNGQYEPGDQGNNEACFDSSKYGNLSIKYDGNNPNSWTQDIYCNKSFSYTNSGSNSISLTTIPPGYQLTGFEYQDSTHPGNNSNCGQDFDNGAGWCVHDSTADTNETVTLTGESQVHFGVKTAPQTFSVSGTIFTDTGKIGYMDGSDADYKIAQPKDVSIYPADDTGVVTGSLIDTKTNGNGGYTFTGLDSGTYLVQYASTNGSGPPTGYSLTYPNNGKVPPSILVNVGNGNPGCWIAQSGQTTLNDATCTNGSITGLNFGITNVNQPWFQSSGGDMRIDGELKNPIPTGLYASIGIASPYADPGILFTAQPSAALTSGVNQSTSASPRGWLSTGNKYKAISGGTRLSYTYLNSVLTRGNVVNSNTIGLTNAGYCGPSHSRSNCVLTSIPKGVYKTDDTITVTGTNNPFQAGANIILLIPGDLNIKSNILVPTGTTVLIAVSGNIIVDPSVTTIEGIYTAEGKFDTGSGTSALKINGALIANSAGGVSYSTLSNIFTNNRNLANNTTTPSVTFNLRPDFLTNLPETLKVPNYVIQEVAPGPSFSFGTSQGATYTPTPTPTPTLTPTPTPTPLATPTPVPTGFLEVNGVVAMEAKNADARVSYTGVSWTNTADTNSVTGTLIRALPDGGVTFTPANAPQAQYKVCFSNATGPGTYYVWLEGYANSTAGNSQNVGIDGTPNATNIDYSTNGVFPYWKNTDNNAVSSKITISTAGLHTINLWAVDDGARVDRIVLKKVNSAPSGNGPTESTRGTCP